MVFGGSSGAALALEAAVTLDAAVTLEANVALDAAARRATDRQAAAPQAHGSRAPACGPAISKLALWEPPYHVDDSAPGLPPDFAARLSALVAAGRPGDAVELFLVRAAQAPAAAVAAMRREPGWPALEALAPTLAYEAAVMGPGQRAAAGRLAAITQPTLVLNGAASPAWMTSAGHAVAGSSPARPAASWPARRTMSGPKRSPPSCWSSSPPDRSPAGTAPAGPGPPRPPGLPHPPDSTPGGGHFAVDLTSPFGHIQPSDNCG